LSFVAVLPNLSFADGDLEILATAVERVRSLAPRMVLLTGILSDAVRDQCRRGCLSTCSWEPTGLRRFQDLIVQPLVVEARMSVGVVGLVGHGDFCPCRPMISDWDGRGAVEALPPVFDIAPGWCVLGRSGHPRLHRDVGPGVAGLVEARRLSSSVVVGDTGRLGVGRLRVVGTGSERLLVGVEAGALSSREPVDRRRRSEFGFAVLTLDGQSVVDAECRSL